MLIYNSKKEFLGIEEHDLNLLGFTNLSELKAEADDFADMFVKTPGYIHNFKHVNWIDFLTCSDSADTPKVIIVANSKSFKCTLDVKTAYLTDEPSSKAFLVYLNNIKELTDSEHEKISGDIVNRPSPAPIVSTAETIETSPAKEIVEETSQEENIIEETPPEETAEIQEALPEEYIETPSEDLDIPIDLDFHDDIEESHEDEIAADLPNDEIKLDLDEEESLENALKLDIEEPEIQIEEPEAQIKEVEYTEEAVYDNGYIYNPQIASDELGLPVELIEEFIEDFVAQAKEFKDELYLALDEGDKDNVKILSHKLKGVAANLRIEDAFEVLTVINTSSDNDQIKTNLDTLYKIIAKLSGEKIVVTQNKIIEEQAENLASDEVNEVKEFGDEEQDDEIEIDFKLDEPTIETTETNEVKEFNNEDQDDEIEIDFKLDEPTIETTETDEFEAFGNEEQDESIELEIKSDEPIQENIIHDNEVPEKIDIPELVDDEFLNQSDEEKIEIDDTLNLETITDEETLSLENETVEIDDIELLEGYDAEGEETLDIENIEIEPSPIEYDKTYIANEIGIPYESFMELFNDYVDEAQEISDSIAEAIEANNTKVWKSKALKLKGMSDNMRVHEFTKELQTLMTTEDIVVAKDANNAIAKSITEISKLKG